VVLRAHREAEVLASRAPAVQLGGIAESEGGLRARASAAVRMMCPVGWRQGRVLHDAASASRPRHLAVEWAGSVYFVSSGSSDLAAFMRSPSRVLAQLRLPEQMPRRILPQDTDYPDSIVRAPEGDTLRAGVHPDAMMPRVGDRALDDLPLPSVSIGTHDSKSGPRRQLALAGLCPVSLSRTTAANDSLKRVMARAPTAGQSALNEAWKQ